MKFMDVTVCTLLILVLHLEWTTAVRFFRNCDIMTSVSDDTVIMVEIDGYDWRDYTLSCQMEFHGEDGLDDEMHFEVMKYTNRDHVNIKVEGAYTGEIYTMITDSLYVDYVNLSKYNSIRITVERSSRNDKQFYMEMKVNTADIPDTSIRAILGSVFGCIAIILIISLAITIYCCCPKKRATNGIILAPPPPNPDQPAPAQVHESIPMTTYTQPTAPAPYIGQYRAYPGQYSYPQQVSMAQPMYPGYPIQPSGNYQDAQKQQQHYEDLPPPYPGNEEPRDTVDPA